MELLVAILITLGFITPETACNMPAPELHQFVAEHQAVIDQGMQDPLVMQQANVAAPTLIDRLED